ncbi:MAG: hypothetical protein CBC02_000165 [Flavobacteriaceae bacterium TMED42]|nr:MAG: hypothetical protein CBC02_000165 [Flavobacteriaceae bacterium TMED42]
MYEKVNDNAEFCEQIGEAMIKLGVQETMSCMARMMAAVAQKEGGDIQFDCDLGTVSVERKSIALNG